MKHLCVLIVLLCCFSFEGFSQRGIQYTPYVENWDKNLAGQALLQRQAQYDQNRNKIQQKVEAIKALFAQFAGAYQYNESRFNSLAVDFDYFTNTMVPSIQGDFGDTNIFYSWWNWLDEYQYKLIREYSN